jgi:hypothetical protein
VALGRKNFLFAGSDGGGESAAAIYSLLGTAKLNGIDPGKLSPERVVPYRELSHQPHRGVTAMERRHKSVTRNRRSGLNKDAAGKIGVGSSSELPHIAELISDGEITVGTLVPVGCVAVATDGHNGLAMLKRREGETLAQLLTRLDLAIGKAFTEDVFTDEINTPANSKRPQPLASLDFKTARSERLHF